MPLDKDQLIAQQIADYSSGGLQVLIGAGTLAAGSPTGGAALSSGLAQLIKRGTADATGKGYDSAAADRTVQLPEVQSFFTRLREARRFLQEGKDAAALNILDALVNTPMAKAAQAAREES